MKHFALILVAFLPLPAHAQDRTNCSPSRAAMMVTLAGLNQYQREYVVKDHLLRCACEAHSENLRRELKNADAFVRWAASVELNRRWKAEKAVVKSGPKESKPLPLLKSVPK